jgi:anaerobic selenocysteine-containing dehydrogenase
MVESDLVKALVILHDEAFSSAKETERLTALVKAARFSLVLETRSSELGRAASAQMPVATYLEENDAVTTHHGELRPYQRALLAPKGILPAAQLAAELAKSLVTA